MSKCTKCGTELVPGMKFCCECGSPVPQTKSCPNCGTELMPTAKFCFNCGAPLNGAPTPGVSGATVGGHAVVAGDVVSNVTNATYVTNADETKKVVQCHVCGKALTVIETYNCPVCGKPTCARHYDTERKMCTACRDKRDQEAEEAFRLAVRKELDAGTGRVDDAIHQRLRERRQELGLDERRGREILEEERRKKHAVCQSGLTDVQRKCLDRARWLVLNDGDCVEAVRHLDQVLQDVDTPNEEILSVLLPALLVCDEKRGDAVVAAMVVDSLPVALYRIDGALKRGNLVEAERFVQEAEKMWPEEALVKCRRAKLWCDTALQMHDSDVCDKAASLMEDLAESDDLEIRSWRHYILGLVAKAKDDEPSKEDDSLLKALASGRLAEGRPLSYSETEAYRKEIAAYFKSRGLSYFPHVKMGDCLFDFAVSTDETAVLVNAVNMPEVLERCEQESKRGKEDLEKQEPSAVTFRVFVSDNADVIRRWLKDKTICVVTPKESLETIDRMLTQAEADVQYFDESSAAALSRQGMAWLQGDGCPKSEDKAFKCLAKSAAAGCHKGVSGLAECYYNGWGCDRNFKEAIRLYTLAAQDADCAGFALYSLGFMAERGEGLERSVEAAERFYRMAAERGNKAAKERLESLQAEKLRREREREQAEARRLAEMRARDEERRVEEGRRAAAAARRAAEAREAEERRAEIERLRQEEERRRQEEMRRKELRRLRAPERRRKIWKFIKFLIFISIVAVVWFKVKAWIGWISEKVDTPKSERTTSSSTFGRTSSTGFKQTYQPPAPAICGACNGQGSVVRQVPCPTCHGQGRVANTAAQVGNAIGGALNVFGAISGGKRGHKRPQIHIPSQPTYITCPTCNGSRSSLQNSPCRACGGTGRR